MAGEPEDEDHDPSWWLLGLAVVVLVAVVAVGWYARPRTVVTSSIAFSFRGAEADAADDLTDVLPTVAAELFDHPRRSHGFPRRLGSGCGADGCSGEGDISVDGRVTEADARRLVARVAEEVGSEIRFDGVTTKERTVWGCPSC